MRARRLVDALRAKQPMNKALGGHFLVHDDVLERTVEWAEVDVEDHGSKLASVRASHRRLARQRMQSHGH